MTQLQWSFQPTYFTQVFGNKEVVNLLLAGIAERLQAPVSLYEMNDEKLTSVPPVNEMRHYPRFCKRLANGQPATEAGDAIAVEHAGQTNCISCRGESLDRIERAFKELKPDGMLELPCHMGLTVVYAPIVLEDRILAICASGKFADENGKECIRRKVEQKFLDQEKAGTLLPLIDEITTKNRTKTVEFKRAFRRQMDLAQEVAKQYLTGIRQQSRLGIRNEIGRKLDKGLELPGETLKEKIRAVLEDLKVFFEVPFVALFCTERTGDNVLPLFSQVGLEDKDVETVHLNWEKAGLPATNFDLGEWLSQRIGLAGYPGAILQRALKCPGKDLFMNASLLLPCQFGDHDRYRGVFLLGTLQRQRAAAHTDFLLEIGHIIVERVFALVVLESLREQDEKRAIMTRLWAHDTRHDLHRLINLSALIEMTTARAQMTAQDRKELNEAVELVNRTVDNMAVKATRALNAPETAIIQAMDETVLRLAYYPLPALVQQCVDRVEAYAKGFNVSAFVHPSVYDLPQISMDQDLIRVVFDNILENAVKYSSSGSEIRVFGSKEGSYGESAEIRIQSKGIGIDEDELASIFQLGYRSSKASGTPGTGLGLYQAKRYVDLHNGEIRAESKPLGARWSLEQEYLTTITVSLPTALSRKEAKHGK